MSIKRGKWARDKYNNIFKVETLLIVRMDNIDLSKSYIDTLQLAYDPRELIKVGDIIYMRHEVGNYYMIVKRLHIFRNKLKYVTTNDITYQELSIENIDCILTRNRKGDFIKQWEVKEK